METIRGVKFPGSRNWKWNQTTVREERIVLFKHKNNKWFERESRKNEKITNFF